MRPGQAVRGAALAETAIVLTATLAMIFGIIQIGVIGFLQIMVDGAAFIAAHEYALGNTTTYQTIAQRPFPLLGSIYIDQNFPNLTTVAVNYFTGNTTQRHGGVSLVLGSHLQATVTKSAPSGLLGVGIAALSNVSIHGAAIEPENLVSNNVYDVNGIGYSGNSSAQSNFYTNVQNAPANYISQHEMAICTALSFTALCPGGSVAIRSLGTAEFLDHDNWQRTNLGVGAFSSAYTFGEMLCHQQKFTQAALTVFVPVSTTAGLPANVSTTNVLTVVGQIYAWDYLTSLGGGYSINETVYGQSPMFPGLYC